MCSVRTLQESYANTFGTLSPDAVTVYSGSNSIRCTGSVMPGCALSRGSMELVDVTMGTKLRHAKKGSQRNAWETFGLETTAIRVRLSPNIRRAAAT